MYHHIDSIANNHVKHENHAIKLLNEKGASDIKVFGGGIIPEDEIPGLKKAGVAEIFTPGADTNDIVKWVEGNIEV
mgnify:CR=1 FL=1